MAALGPLIRGELPPVGGRVALRPGSAPSFAGYEPLWLDSGTAALALALMCARGAHPENKTPEVILPGYGCPDLISAAIYAGLQPVLADLAVDEPAYDLASLRSMITPSTVAVVAVNFLGVAERLGAIRGLLVDHPGVALVEDNAQWYPEPDGVLSGDYVCLSFGRGKPVSLLGGGALLVKSCHRERAISIATRAVAETGLPAGLAYRAKVHAFNMLLQPQLYALAARNPWVSVGATCYDPLPGIGRLGDREALVGPNVEAYLLRPRTVEHRLSEIVASSRLVARDLVQTGRAGRLLRYPILCKDQATQGQLLARAESEGLGVTAMYRRTLPEIDGAAARITRAAKLPHAESFAQRLLTLPVHAGIGDQELVRLGRWLGARG